MYRRYFGDDSGPADPSTLRGDMTAWVWGRFTKVRATEFENPVRDFWAAVADRKPQSNLPKLAAMILSITVNSATCERLFSEFTAIHTVGHNRLKMKKVVRAHHVRKRLREEVETVEKKRFNIISPDERRVIDSSAAAQQHQPEDDSSTSNYDAVSDDDADICDSVGDQDLDDEAPTMEFLLQFLDEVFIDDMNEDEEDENVEPTSAVESSTLPFRDADDDDEAVDSPYQSIPAPDRRPFPSYNDKRFPQEKRPGGFRSLKAPLAVLFGSLSRETQQ